MVKIEKTRPKVIRIFCAVLLLIFCWSVPLSAWAETSDSSDSAQSNPTKKEVISVLEGKTAGVTTGTPQDQIVKDNIPSAQLKYYNNIADLTLALTSGKVDFIVLSSVNFFSLAEQYPELGYLNVDLKTYDVGTIFPKNAKGTKLCKKFNRYIQEIKENRKLDRLQEYWLYPSAWDNISIPKTGRNGTLQMATSNTFKPFSFMLNGKNVGFDIAVAAGFCKEYGYGLQIENVDFAGALSGIAAGKYDLAAGQISWTEERAKSVLFSDFYYTQKLVPIMVASNFNSQYMVTASEKDSSNDSGIGTSIRRTLLDESRWKDILRGLGITLLITLAGFAVANILGAFFCMLSLSKSKLLCGISGVYSGLMQGLPVVVILMILYYVIFSHSRSNVLVAIIGFGLVFGAYMAQLFEGSISAVDKGQWEAALAMGLTKYQAFQGIVLPQAIRKMVPAYFSNLISLLKGTAIVGYIAVTDLTKVGDIIRSNTYEAVVPLMTVALIYLALAGLIILLMNLIRRKLSENGHRKSMRSRNSKVQRGGDAA